MEDNNHEKASAEVPETGAVLNTPAEAQSKSDPLAHLLPDWDLVPATGFLRRK